MAVLAADTKCSGMMSLGPTMQSIRLSSCGPRAHCSGYEWGMPTGQPFTHRHVRLRRITCMQRNRRRRATTPHLHPRSLKYVPAHKTHVADPVDITVATTMDARGQRRKVHTYLMSPSSTFPGYHVTARISACRPPDAPARLPRAMLLPSMSWPCRCSVGGTLASKGGGTGGTVHGRAGVSVWPAP